MPFCFAIYILLVQKGGAKPSFKFEKLSWEMVLVGGSMRNDQSNIWDTFFNGRWQDLRRFIDAPQFMQIMWLSKGYAKMAI